MTAICQAEYIDKIMHIFLKAFLGILFLSFTPFVCAQENVRVINYAQLENIMEERTSSVKIINFWATWCPPCVREIPFFIQAEKKFEENKNVEFIYVSMDKQENIAKVQTLVEKKGLQGTSVLLNAPQNQDLINAVHAQWQGAIPMTLFVQNGEKKKFYEGAFLNTAHLVSMINATFEE